MKKTGGLTYSEIDTYYRKYARQMDLNTCLICTYYFNIPDYINYRNITHEKN